MKAALKHRPILILAMVLAAAFPLPVFAGPREDAIGEAALRAGGQALATEFTREYLNRSFPNALPTRIAPHGVGSAVVAAVQLGMAIHDYSRAEDDRGRTYAGARAAAAGLMFVNPAAGAAASLAIMAIGLAEAAMSVGHMETMMRIQAETLRYQREMVGHYTAIATSEVLRFENANRIMADAHRSMLEKNAALRSHCTDPERIATAENLGYCVETIVAVVMRQLVVVDQARLLLRSPVVLINRDALFRHLRVDARKLNEEVETLSRSATVALAELGDYIRNTSQSLARATLEDARRASLPNPRQQFSMNCIDSALFFVRVSSVYQIADPGPPGGIIESLRRVDLASLIRSSDLFDSLGCDNSSLVDESLRPRVTAALTLYREARQSLGELSLASP